MATKKKTKKIKEFYIATIDDGFGNRYHYLYEDKKDLLAPDVVGVYKVTNYDEFKAKKTSFEDKFEKAA